jgi:hypothetical protein
MGITTYKVTTSYIPFELIYATQHVMPIKVIVILKEFKMFL